MKSALKPKRPRVRLTARCRYSYGMTIRSASRNASYRLTDCCLKTALTCWYCDSVFSVNIRLSTMDCQRWIANGGLPAMDWRTWHDEDWCQWQAFRIRSGIYYTGVHKAK